MCAINPSFHIPSLNSLSFFPLMVTIMLSPENLPGKKARTKYCIKKTKHHCFFSILIVIYLWEQRDATFYDNSVVASQW